MRLNNKRIVRSQGEWQVCPGRRYMEGIKKIWIDVVMKKGESMYFKLLAK